jgi:hypothetical protein
MRSHDQPAQKLVLRQPTSGFRQGGGAVKTYPKLIVEDLVSTNRSHIKPTNDQVTNLAQERKLWKTYLSYLP